MVLFKLVAPYAGRERENVDFLRFVYLSQKDCSNWKHLWSEPDKIHVALDEDCQTVHMEGA